MNTLRLTTDKKIYDGLINHLNKKLNFSYSFQSTDTLVLAGEEYRFRTNSQQLYFFIFSTNESEMNIEITCGGGGGGIFNISLGSESAFLKEMNNLILKYCESNGVILYQIE